MKVVIYATDGVDLMVSYPALGKYGNFYDKGKHCIIKEMDNDELMKIIQMLTNYYGELVVDSDMKTNEFYIEIYNDCRE